MHDKDLLLVLLHVVGGSVGYKNDKILKKLADVFDWIWM
jgi:hypothetical protein